MSPLSGRYGLEEKKLYKRRENDIWEGMNRSFETSREKGNITRNNNFRQFSSMKNIGNTDGEEVKRNGSVVFPIRTKSRMIDPGSETQRAAWRGHTEPKQRKSNISSKGNGKIEFTDIRDEWEQNQSSRIRKLIEDNKKYNPNFVKQSKHDKNTKIANDLDLYTQDDNDLKKSKTIRNTPLLYSTTQSPFSRGSNCERKISISDFENIGGNYKTPYTGPIISYSPYSIEKSFIRKSSNRTSTPPMPPSRSKLLDSRIEKLQEEKSMRNSPRNIADNSLRTRINSPHVSPVTNSSKHTINNTNNRNSSYNSSKNIIHMVSNNPSTKITPRMNSPSNIDRSNIGGMTKTRSDIQTPSRGSINVDNKYIPKSSYQENKRSGLGVSQNPIPTTPPELTPRELGVGTPYNAREQSYINEEDTKFLQSLIKRLKTKRIERIKNSLLD